jgi:hypothetical protein
MKLLKCDRCGVIEPEGVLIAMSMSTLDGPLCNTHVDLCKVCKKALLEFLSPPFPDIEAAE